MQTPERFRTILRQAQGGDRQAAEELLELVRPHLEMLARSVAGSPRQGGSASDLVQEACLRIWLKLDQFEGTEDLDESFAMFRAWMEQLVHRLDLNALRAQQAQRRQPAEGLVPLPMPEPGESFAPDHPPAREPTPSGYVRQAEEAERVRAALEKLPSDTGRQIVRLHFFEGLSLRQIADRLQLSYDKVREQYQASLRHLERELGLDS